MFTQSETQDHPSNHSIALNDSLQTRMIAYESTQKHNDELHLEFTRKIKEIPFLSRHREYVEANQLGFGDAAFHYLWYLLLQHINQTFAQPRLLEIGVYKGQVISLWKLIESQLQGSFEVSAISPLQGNPLPRSRWLRRWKQLTDSKLRWSIDAGSIYADEDYLACIEQIFNEFNLNLIEVQLVKGYSTDPEIVEQFQKQTFSLIYVDGDHTYDGVKFDIEHYASLVELNGFLVMDDASYYMPGTVFWKGYEPVSRACELILPMRGFVNVMNIGHNRVYQKVH